ncbi:MAG: hypothetical protein LBM02_09525 [Lachnospiraceae bacterium]|nr:hypothetical protein [Lachnospiraceae bacterium]
MRNRNFVICDGEYEYAKRFAKFFNDKKIMDLQINLCETKEEVLKLSEKIKIDYLLVDCEIADNLENEIEGSKIFIWGNSKEVSNDEIHISKYILYPEIISEICENIEVFDSHLKKENRKINSKIQVIYSPFYLEKYGNLTDKIACILGNKGKVLRVSLKGDCFNQNLGEGKNIGDLLYYALQEESNFKDFMQENVIRENGYDSIFGFKYIHESLLISLEEWLQLFDKLQNESDYDTILLEINDLNLCLFEIFDLAEKIMIFSDDRKEEKAYFDLFIKELVAFDKEEIKEKIEVIKCEL